MWVDFLINNNVIVRVAWTLIVAWRKMFDLFRGLGRISRLSSELGPVIHCWIRDATLADIGRIRNSILALVYFCRFGCRNFSELSGSWDLMHFCSSFSLDVGFIKASGAAGWRIEVFRCCIDDPSDHSWQETTCNTAVLASRLARASLILLITFKVTFSHRILSWSQSYVQVRSQFLLLSLCAFDQFILKSCVFRQTSRPFSHLLGWARAESAGKRSKEATARDTAISSLALAYKILFFFRIFQDMLLKLTITVDIRKLDLNLSDVIDQKILHFFFL